MFFFSSEEIRYISLQKLNIVAAEAKAGGTYSKIQMAQKTLHGFRSTEFSATILWNEQCSDKLQLKKSWEQKQLNQKPMWSHNLFVLHANPPGS